MDWERVNIWTNTLYALIQSLHISRQIQFGNLPLVSESIVAASTWIDPECSYASTLTSHPFGRQRPTFRRDPNKHIDEISAQVVKMLVQDLVVIFDEMMAEILRGHGLNVDNFPQSKVQRLRARLDPKFEWAAAGCLELIAVRNVLTHSEGRWNEKSLRIIAPFVNPLPMEGDALKVGFSMLFRYRKAMRTLLNQVSR